MKEYGSKARYENYSMYTTHCSYVVARWASSRTICEFAYDDTAPWPTAADGSASLVLIAPRTHPDPALPQSWRASTTAALGIILSPVSTNMTFSVL